MNFKHLKDSENHIKTLPDFGKSSILQGGKELFYRVRELEKEVEKIKSRLEILKKVEK